MKKLFVFVVSCFMFIESFNATSVLEEVTIANKAGYAFDLNALDYVENADTVTVVDYNLSYKAEEKELISFPDSTCTAGDSDEIEVVCSNTTGEFKGIKITEPGVYDVTLTYTLDTEERFTRNITFKIKTYKYEQTKQVMEVPFGRQFSITKGNELDSTLYMFRDYIDYDLITIPPTTNCLTENGQYADVYECFSEESTYGVMQFKKIGSYELLENYMIETDTEFIEYDKTYVIIVQEQVEVTKEDKEVNVDNLVVISSLKEHTLTSDVLVPKENALESIMVSKEEFNKAKDNKVNLVYRIKDEFDNLKYSWEFNSANLKTTENVLNLKLDVEEISETLKSEFKQENALLLKFAHHGDLPGEANVLIYVGDKYKTGDKLNFYYNNEESGKIELVTKDVLVDEEGYVKVTITHCSEYILDKIVDTTSSNNSTVENTPQLDDEPKMGDNSTYQIIILILLITISGIYFIKKNLVKN